MELTLVFIVSQICGCHTMHTVSGACGGPYHQQHNIQRVDAFFFIYILPLVSRGVARGSAVLASQNVVWVMAV